MLMLVFVRPLVRKGAATFSFSVLILFIFLGGGFLSILMATYDILHESSVQPLCIPTMYPLTAITNQPDVSHGNSRQHATSTTHDSVSTFRKRQRRENDDHGDRNPKQPRRGRSSIYHPGTPKCRPCILWQQSGSDPSLLHLHPQNNMRHAGNDTRELETYAYTGELRTGSSM